MNDKTKAWLFFFLGFSTFSIGIGNLLLHLYPWAIICMMSGIWTMTFALFVRQKINSIDRRFEQLTRLLIIHFKEDREKVDWTKEGF